MHTIVQCVVTVVVIKATLTETEATDLEDHISPVYRYGARVGGSK